jgi:ABC-2 type transport system permease protein
MIAAFHAEVRKIVSTRLWWVTLICVFVLAAGYAALPATVGVLETGAGSTAFRDPGTVRSIYNGGNPLSRTLALVVGIMALAGEYRHRTISSTYLATPRRYRLLLAKAASLFLFGLLYGAASVLAGVLVAIPYVLGNDGSFFLHRGDTWRSLVLGVVSIALWTMIGMGLGILIQNLVVALLVGIGFTFLVEPLVSYVLFRRGWDLALNLLPSGATNAMLDVTSPVLFASAQPMAWWGGTAVLAAWCLLPAVVGAVVTVRRDVL